MMTTFKEFIAETLYQLMLHECFIKLEKKDGTAISKRRISEIGDWLDSRLRQLRGSLTLSNSIKDGDSVVTFYLTVASVLPLEQSRLDAFMNNENDLKCTIISKKQMDKELGRAFLDDLHDDK
jgi:hypothetical protein